MLPLPTYEDCLKICESNNSFYESKHQLDGYNISIFNYHIANYEDFFKLKAFELRGLTFVFNLDGTLYKRYILMEKFFNLNENESTKLEILENKRIKNIYLKEDGSIINFIKLPNGKVFAKSKTSFTSEQASLAQTIIDRDEVTSKFVNRLLDDNLMPIFELVSPKNQIVIKYDKTKLILLRVRNNFTGEYLELNEFDYDKPKLINGSLKDLIGIRNEIENIEGWVIEFEDSKKIKIKTTWYLNLHKIFTDFSNREDYLISLILNEKIDDVLSVLEYGSESRNFVESVINKTLFILDEIIRKVDDKLVEFDGDRKYFVKLNLKDELFPIYMKIIDGKDKKEVIKEFVLKKTYRLSQAREWLDMSE